MAVYLITYEPNNKKNYDLIQERISKLGDSIRPLSSLWLVNTTLSYNELYNHVIAVAERYDMFYITSIGSAGIGRLDLEDTNWIKNKFLMQVTPLASAGNPKGPLPIQNAVSHKPLPVHGRQQYPKLHWE